MQAPSSRKPETHFALLVKRRHLDCLLLGWYPAVLQLRRGCEEREVSMKELPILMAAGH